MRITLTVALAATTMLVVLAIASVASLQFAASGGRASVRPGMGVLPVATLAGLLPPRVVLSWPATPGATGYRVVRTGGTGSVGGTCAGTVTATSCADTAVVAFGDYSYAVTPLAGGWVGGTSRTAAVMT